MNPPGHGAQCITFGCVRAPLDAVFRRAARLRVVVFPCVGVCAYPVRIECGHACGGQEAEICTGRCATRVAISYYITPHTRDPGPSPRPARRPAGAARAPPLLHTYSKSQK